MTESIQVGGQAETCVPANDRGLTYGDGLFETIACAGGRFLLWDRHMRRLETGCERLAFPMPDWEPLSSEAERLRADQSRGVLKILMTRGDGERGYRPPEQTRLRRILSWHDLPEGEEVRNRCRSGVRIRSCRTPISIQPLLAGLKHCNRLDQVMARLEWRDESIAEGLMYDPEGQVISGTSSNLFLVREGRLFTPKLSRSGVAGCMRAEVLDTARTLDLHAEITDLGRADLEAADEMFLTNSLFGIRPVREWDGVAKIVGPLTRRLQARCASAWPAFSHEPLSSP